MVKALNSLIKNILVVGGAGYIGSQVNLLLNEKGYQTIILDNLSRGHPQAVIKGTLIQGDICDKECLHALFSRYQIDAVMHFAALTDVGESIKEPLQYYLHNVGFTLNLLHAMRQFEVQVLIFSSSAAVYGVPQEPYINESHRCDPINPYGTTKLTVERILKDMDLFYGIRSICLRYFNAAGGDPRGLIKYHKRLESNLIPRILNSLHTGEQITINGNDYQTMDGTCVRDYIHIEDLARAHVVALERLMSGQPSNFYNLGNGKGFTIKEVVQAVENVTRKPVKTVLGPRRPGDPPFLVSNASKAEKELSWKPEYPSLEAMIEHAWKARSQRNSWAQ